MSTVRNSIIMVILWGAMVLIALLTYWSVYPYKVMTVEGVTIVNPAQQVYAGEEVIIRIKSRKYMNIPATVYRELLNDHAWPLPTFRSNVPAEETDWHLRVKIPETAPDGSNYRVHTTYKYKVNPIREVTVEWTTPDFSVKSLRGKNGHSG